MRSKTTEPFIVISGPCAVESQKQISAHLCEFTDHEYFRGGVYKLRTSPDSFQGLREEGIPIVEAAKLGKRFKFVSEAVSAASLEKLDRVTDIFQIGTRNMYNYELLKELGRYEKPVILKRGFSATIDEFLKAAEYIGLPNEKIYLCERGIRSFETKYRNTLDFNAIAYIKEYTDFKILVDPSHGSGDPRLIEPLSKAALAAGADGLLVETHYKPDTALSDGAQALSFESMKKLKKDLIELGQFFNREVIF